MKTIKIMMTFILLMGLSHSYGKCRPPTNPKEVNIFLDLNGGAEEIEVAKEEACRQGKALKVLPEFKERKRFARIARQKDRFVKKYMKKCKGEEDICRGNAEFKAKKFNDQLNEILPQKLNASLLKKGLKDIQAKNPHIPLGRMIISGRHSMGFFSGKTGDLSRHDIEKVFESFPQMGESVKSLYLLGSYTGTAAELGRWGDIFPSALFINGYEGQAPLNYRKKGLAYLKSSMEREKDIFAAQDREELKRAIASIDKIHRGYTGLRVTCSGLTGSDGEPFELDAFGAPADGGDFFRERNREDDLLPWFCTEKKQREIEKAQALLDEYYWGEKSLPETTENSPLRKAYNFLSRYRDCSRDEREEEDDPEEDEEAESENQAPYESGSLGKLFALNFYDSFKKNALTSSEMLKRGLKRDKSIVDLGNIEAVTKEVNRLMREEIEDNRLIQEGFISAFDFEKMDERTAKAHLHSLLNSPEYRLSEDERNYEARNEFGQSGDAERSPEEIRRIERKINLREKITKLFHLAVGKKPLSKGQLKKAFPVLKIPPIPSGEVKGRYSSYLQRVKEIQKAYIDLIPSPHSKAYGTKEKNLSEASRREVLADFDERKTREDELWAEIEEAEFDVRLERDQGWMAPKGKEGERISAANSVLLKAVSSVVLSSTDKVRRKARGLLKNYGDSAVSLNCVPFEWHELKAKGSLSLDEKACDLTLMED